MKNLIALSISLVMVGGCQPEASSADANLGSSIKSTYSTGEPAPAAESNAPAEAGNKEVPLEDQPLEEPKFEEPKDGDEVGVIETKFGKIVVKFRPDKAPKHVENFKKLAKEGFYNGTIFHRVIPGFMIQGGDPNTKDKSKVDTYGQGGPGYGVIAEFNNLDHKRGVLSMARSGDPNSAGSQFFVMVADYPSLNKQYSAFGEVVSGLEVADKIVNQPRNGNDMPDERVEMKVRIAKWPVK